MHEITIRISLNTRHIRLALLLFFFLAFPKLSATQDEPQLWGYFPAPTAMFPTIEAKSDLFVPPSIELARDYGNLVIGVESSARVGMLVRQSTAFMPPGGRRARLSVNGTLRVNGCLLLKNGNIFLSGTTPIGWTGSAWQGGNLDNPWWRCSYYPP